VSVRLIAALWLVAASALAEAAPAPAPAEDLADARLPLARLLERFGSLDREHGWQREDIYVHADDPALRITAWRTAHVGPALWLIAGVHGEEPAGANALQRELPVVVELARAGIPIVLVPVASPRAYRNHWRYPNTPERDWRAGGGYSVGDSEYLLPDLETGAAPRAAKAPGPETLALTQFVLRTARTHPPLLVLDLHEDELSREGGYIYSQGVNADANPVGAEVVRLLKASGMPLRSSGLTRFGEPIVDGVISRDDRGGPIRDGSIDELLAAPEVFVAGRKVPGPAARTVIVVETPAFAGSQFERRVAAHAAVVRNLPQLWRLNGPPPPSSPPPAPSH
jgi:hypothetical protein